MSDDRRTKRCFFMVNFHCFSKDNLKKTFSNMIFFNGKSVFSAKFGYFSKNIKKY